MKQRGLEEWHLQEAAVVVDQALQDHLNSIAEGARELGLVVPAADEDVSGFLAEQFGTAQRT